MITLVYEGNKYVIKSKKLVIYAKKNLILTKMIEMHLNHIIKYEIIVIMLKNIEKLLKIFVI